MLKGIQNFLQFLNDNWTAITVIIALALALYGKIKSFVKKSNAEKIEIAKVQAKEIILKWVTDAEIDYDNWEQSGSIKRAQVIQRIFNDYPILTKTVDQKEVIEWIDETINNSLKELRKIVAMNKQKEDDLSDDESE